MDNLIDKAVNLLKSGEVIGIPTETVYGLAACIDNKEALNRIFKIKERPFFDPLIVHVSSRDDAKKLTLDWNIIADKLVQKFWPGPLTLVLKKNSLVSSLITSGLDTVAIRMPNHPVTLELLYRIKVPLAAPSANKFGKTSPTHAEHVRSEFKNENIFVLDGGPCEIGIESTVLSIETQENQYVLSLLRKGFISVEDIKQCLINENIKWNIGENVNALASPGNMKHHYMPSVPFVLCKKLNLSKTDILFEINKCLKNLPQMTEGIKLPPLNDRITDFVELKLSNNPQLAARELYAQLRELSRKILNVFCFI